MGDGGVVTCSGPGVAFDTADPSANPSTYCSYRYFESSAGQPSPDGDTNQAAFTVRATVNWSVSWTATGASGGGVLPPLTTAAAAQLRVEQVESVDTDLLGLASTGGSTGGSRR
jgi:hypothetical protein